MVEQLRETFEKFVDWWQCAAVMLLFLPLHQWRTAARPRIFQMALVLEETEETHGNSVFYPALGIRKGALTRSLANIRQTSSVHVFDLEVDLNIKHQSI
jgi:hypothetical protein